jgi:hypothetical protein
MNLYDAIKEMRRISAENGVFSFVFMSYNSSEQRSDGVIHVRRGRLLKRESLKHHKNAEIVEAYIDLDTMQSKRFYQPLLMSFNGQKVILR